MSSSFVRKVKESAEWMEHGKTIWEFLIAAFGGTAVRAMLIQFTHLPSVWVTPISLLCAAIVLFLLMRFIGTRSITPVQESTPGNQMVPRAAGLEANITSVETEYQQQVGQYLLAIQDHFRRMAAHFTDASERENFLIRALSVGALVVYHDGTWNSIYKSQLDLLQELNVQPLTIDKAKPLYDAAATADPNRYGNYPFEYWLAYMRQQEIVLQDGNVLGITPRGKDFLRYIVQKGLSTRTRLA